MTDSPVPLQWSVRGDPTWSADKRIGRWIPVAIFGIDATLLLSKARSTVPAATADDAALILCCPFCVGGHGRHVSNVVEGLQRQP